MLCELRVRDLGVIDDLTLVLGPGMTALTGETGAGKTLLVDAIQLLLGSRADPVLVRPGAKEAVVEGRFTLSSSRSRPLGPAKGSEDEELVVCRVVPAHGKSRAYIDGRMASASALAEATGALVDLHGQHAHQALLAPSTQRSALDAAGGVDLEPLARARRRLTEIDHALAEIGGDPRARAREADLLGYQLEELDGAKLSDPDEDTALQEEESWLADASAHREAAAEAWMSLAGEGAATDAIGAALSAVAGREPLAELETRLRGLAAEATEAASDLREASESLQDDPQRLAEVGERRRLLAELRRKYGDTLAEVIEERERIRERLDELGSYDERAAELSSARTSAAAKVEAEEKRVGDARRRAAPALSKKVQTELRKLAMPRARFSVSVSEEPLGAEVVFLLAANPGEPELPLTKVASGGELARCMLAARLVLTQAGAPDAGDRTMVFDEVDAGIGGEAAVSVGRALAGLAGAPDAGQDSTAQVLVVTHLPQVAAFADAQIGVHKEAEGERTVSRVNHLGGAEREIELSRMLAGRPDSKSGRKHAAELLQQARRDRAS